MRHNIALCITLVALSAMGLVNTASAQGVRTTGVNVSVGSGFPGGWYDGYGYGFAGRSPRWPGPGYFAGRSPRWPGPGAFNAPGGFPGFVNGAPYGAWPGTGYGRNWYENYPGGPGWEFYDQQQGFFDPCYGASVLNPQCRGFGYGPYGYQMPYGYQVPYGYGYGPGGINVSVVKQTVQPMPPQYARTTAPAPLAVPTEVVTPQVGLDQPPTFARENTYEQAAAMALPVDLSGVPDQPASTSRGGRAESGKPSGGNVDRAARQGVRVLADEVQGLKQRQCEDEERAGIPLNPKCKAK